jgi:hypothetical protein
VGIRCPWSPTNVSILALLRWRYEQSFTRFCIFCAG